ncbi:MAG: response regulator [Planctomycetes bacterium]|nr:response regulator [Planctomycetota bacterium]
MTKILVVDDDRRIALSLAVRLKQEGYEVLEANDGVTAVKKAIEDTPDVVLLDISMPAGNGLIVAERLRDNVQTATLPIIFLTASKRKDLREQAEQWGPVAFLEKPFDSEQVLREVRKALQVQWA